MPQIPWPGAEGSLLSRATVLESLHWVLSILRVPCLCSAVVCHRRAIFTLFTRCRQHLTCQKGLGMLQESQASCSWGHALLWVDGCSFHESP